MTKQPGTTETLQGTKGDAPSARRPYSAPRVQTRPLFERMALACSVKDPLEGIPNSS